MIVVMTMSLSVIFWISVYFTIHMSKLVVAGDDHMLHFFFLPIFISVERLQHLHAENVGSAQPGG